MVFYFLFYCERKQCKLTCSLDSECEISLMLCAVACYAAGKNLSSFGNVLLKCSHIFIIYRFCLLAAEYADFASSVEASHLSGACSLFAFCLLECHRFSSLVFHSDQLKGSPSSSTPSGMFIKPCPTTDSSAMGRSKSLAGITGSGLICCWGCTCC